jgi:DNA-binding response OmpR family regulator
MHCLIVEDDLEVSGEQTVLLEEMGHDVTVAASISEARQILRARKFALVLIEYMLPDGTSELLSDHVSASCPNARIIMMTGKPIFLYGEHATLTPCVDWLMRKPFPLGDLKALVDYAVIDANQCPTHQYATI